MVVSDIEQGRLNVQKAETIVSLMLYLAQNNEFYKISQFKNSLQHLRERGSRQLGYSLYKLRASMVGAVFVFQSPTHNKLKL